MELDSKHYLSNFLIELCQSPIWLWLHSRHHLTAKFYKSFSQIASLLTSTFCLEFFRTSAFVGSSLTRGWYEYHPRVTCTPSAGNYVSESHTCTLGNPALKLPVTRGYFFTGIRRYHRYLCSHDQVDEYSR